MLCKEEENENYKKKVHPINEMRKQCDEFHYSSEPLRNVIISIFSNPKHQNTAVPSDERLVGNGIN